MKINGFFEKYVKTDKRYFRPTEVDQLIADTAKAKEAFKWQAKVKFHDLIKIMVDADLKALGLEPIGEGDRIIKEKFPGKWWKGD